MSARLRSARRSLANTSLISILPYPTTDQAKNTSDIDCPSRHQWATEEELPAKDFKIEAIENVSETGVVKRLRNVPMIVEQYGSRLQILESGPISNSMFITIVVILEKTVKASYDFYLTCNQFHCKYFRAEGGQVVSRHDCLGHIKGHWNGRLLA